MQSLQVFWQEQRFKVLPLNGFVSFRLPGQILCLVLRESVFVTSFSNPVAVEVGLPKR